MGVLYAFSIHTFINDVGSYAGFAAIVGLGVLSLLYFSQARELGEIRDWADAAAEHIRNLESRAGGVSRVTRAPAPASAAAVPGAAGQQAAAAAAEPAGAVAPAGAPAQAPPVGVGAPALASATRLIPADGAPAAAEKPAPAPAPVVPGAATAAGAGRAVPAAAPAPSAAATAAPPSPPTAAPPSDGPDTEDGDDVTQVVGPLPSLPSNAQRLREPAPPPRGPLTPAARRIGGADRDALARRWAILLVAAGVAVIVVVLLLVTSGGGKSRPTSQTPTNAATAPAAHRKPFQRGSTTVAVLNGTPVAGLASQVANELVRDGFGRGAVTNASDQQRSATIISFFPGHLQDAREVGKALNIGPQAIVAIDPQTRAVVCPGTSPCRATVVVTVGADRNGR
jgi:hypothetical protein